MADSITVFGIPNCDTVKKARKWLDAQSVSYEFHDYKKKGIDCKTLKAFCKTLGWESLVNRRGTTWRKLEDSAKEDLDESKAIALMIENTSLIKRPVITGGKEMLVGFNSDTYSENLL